MTLAVGIVVVTVVCVFVFVAVYASVMADESITHPEEPAPEVVTFKSLSKHLEVTCTSHLMVGQPGHVFVILSDSGARLQELISQGSLTSCGPLRQVEREDCRVRLRQTAGGHDDSRVKITLHALRDDIAFAEGKARDVDVRPVSDSVLLRVPIQASRPGPHTVEVVVRDEDGFTIGMAWVMTEVYDVIPVGPPHLVDGKECSSRWIN